MTNKDSKDKLKLKGKVVLEFKEDDAGAWWCELKPVYLPAPTPDNARDICKLGLMVSAIQKYIRDTLGYVDSILIPSVLEEKVKADVDRLQTELPFPAGTETGRHTHKKPICEEVPRERDGYIPSHEGRSRGPGF